MRWGRVDLSLVRSESFFPLDSFEHRNGARRSLKVPRKKRAKSQFKDVIPYYGLSIHKPSLLWPPPGKEHSHSVRQGIRHGLRKVAGFGEHSRFKSFLGSRGRGPPPKDEPVAPAQVADAGRRMDLGPSMPVPNVIDEQSRSVVLQVKDGETLTVDSQIHFYVSNDLLYHPLICHCRAYLGGLPPLFFVAGDKEVLRDEIIYT